MDKDARSDVELWEQVVAGDAGAFETIYDRYSDRLLSYVVRRPTSPELAEDIVSIVFLEAWRRREDVRGDEAGSLGGWLFRTAINTLRNQSRSLRRHDAALKRLHVAAPVPGIDEEIANRDADEQEARAAVMALESLPRRDREVLFLSSSGLDQAQIGVTLGVPMGTVKSRLTRARRRLRVLTSDRNSSQRTQPVVVPTQSAIQEVS
jgi:RNA polymerase sigma-70 factor (ECF subfamily)